MNCETDLNCPLSRVCVFNQTWQDDYEPNTSISSCECPWRYGLVGEKCTEFTSVTILYVVFCVVVSIALFGLVIAQGKVYLRLYVNGKLDKYSVIVTSLSLLFLGSILLLVYFVIRIWVVFNGDKYSFRSSSKSDPLIDPSDTLISFSVFATLCASMQVSIVWLEIALKTSKLVRHEKKNVSMYAHVVYSFCIVYFIIVLSLLLSDNRNLSVLVSLPFFFILLALFAYAYWKLKKLLGNSSVASSGMEDVKKSTRELTIGVSCAIVMGLTGGVIYGASIFSLERQNISPEPGSWLIPTWAPLLVYASGVIINIFLVRYLYPLSGPKRTSSHTNKKNPAVVIDSFENDEANSTWRWPRKSKVSGKSSKTQPQADDNTLRTGTSSALTPAKEGN